MQSYDLKYEKLEMPNYILRNIFFQYKFYKRLFDLIFAIIFICILSPIFIAISLLVKASSRGDIIYNQVRIGLNKKKFACKKFRTMHPEADDILKKILSENNDIKKEYLTSFKIKNDPRITPIGKFLRITSMDELPQLINVLRGEMSIVGPRPIVNEEIPKYGDAIQEVFSVKPGMTGLWQVSGRNKLSYEKRVYLDLKYAKQRNIVMDIRIIIRTIGVILFPFDRGAY